MTEQHLNIAGYKFVVLDDRDALRKPLKQTCDALGLKGTILLSHEGINIFVSGPKNAIETFTSHSVTISKHYSIGSGKTLA